MKVELQPLYIEQPRLLSPSMYMIGQYSPTQYTPDASNVSASYSESYIQNPVLMPPQNLTPNTQSSILQRLKNGFLGKITSGYNFVKYSISDTYTSLFGADIAQGLYIPPKGTNPDQNTINELLNRAADKYSISRSVFKAIALRESNWRMYNSNGTTVSGHNSTSTDWGIMQINDSAHPKAFPKAKSDIVYNIEYGAQYLSKQYRRYGNWYDAVAAYNAGSAIRKNNKYINQKYVDFVFANIKKFS